MINTYFGNGKFVYLVFLQTVSEPHYYSDNPLVGRGRYVDYFFGGIYVAGPNRAKLLFSKILTILYEHRLLS